MMRLFLYNFLKFTIFTITVIIVFTLYNRYYTFDINYFKLNDDIEYIIVGDSHVECAVDSAIQKTINVGQAAEIFMHSYIKTKLLLEKNKNIKVVFIDFCNSQIDINQDTILWNTPYLIKRYKSYMPFYTKNELLEILNHNYVGLMKAHFKSIPVNLYYSFRYSNILDDNYLGGHQELSTHLDTIQNIDKSKKSINSNLIVTTNLIYLDKIIDLCKKSNVKLFFIRTPIHPKWKYLANELQYIKIKNEKYKDVELLDFKLFPIETNEFADFEHLNTIGARKFTLFFNNLIKDSLIYESNKQEFINKKINDFKHN